LYSESEQPTALKATRSQTELTGCELAELDRDVPVLCSC
jgi:hypothetical protein